MARLHEAAASGNIEQVIEYLDAGDDINQMSEFVMSNGKPYQHGLGEFGRKMTPLHLAVYNNKLAIVELLVQRNAFLDIRYQFDRGSSGATALEIAVSSKNLDLAIRLREWGASDARGDLAKALVVQSLSPAERSKHEWLELRASEYRLKFEHEDPMHCHPSYRPPSNIDERARAAAEAEYNEITEEEASYRFRF